MLAGITELLSRGPRLAPLPRPALVEPVAPHALVPAGDSSWPLYEKKDGKAALQGQVLNWFDPNSSSKASGSVSVFLTTRYALPCV